VAELPASSRRVQEALVARGLDTTIVYLERAARTSEEAAAAVGCRVDQIAKSLVFRLAGSGAPLLVIASGAHRVDEARVAALVGEPLGKADAGFVRAHTGFAIGGVPPLAHPAPLATLIDAHLMGWDRIWAAGGHPHTVFPLTPADLVRITGGRVVDVA
jgi:prolyl-tRNA editing enzyme YbaK/EbsC (Cys-tRNA(Pro) deacylase)